MSSNAFEGTTISFAGTSLGDVVDIEFSENGNPIDVTSAADDFRRFLAGVENIECSITVFGVPATAINTTGTLSVAWNDGTTDNGGGGSFLLSSKTRSGSVGGAITTRLTFVPSGEGKGA